MNEELKKFVEKVENDLSERIGSKGAPITYINVNDEKVAGLLLAILNQSVLNNSDTSVLFNISEKMVQEESAGHGIEYFTNLFPAKNFAEVLPADIVKKLTMYIPYFPHIANSKDVLDRFAEQIKAKSVCVRRYFPFSYDNGLSNEEEYDIVRIVSEKSNAISSFITNGTPNRYKAYCYFYEPLECMRGKKIIYDANNRTLDQKIRETPKQSIFDKMFSFVSSSHK